MLNWLVYAVVGKILIYLWQILPLPKFVDKGIFKKLHECDLCSGFWVYSILAIAMQVDLFEMNLITQIATGAVTTFVAHIFSIGWREKFSPPIVI